MIDIPRPEEAGSLSTRALLIGIDQYPDIPPERRLRGSVNDVLLMERALVEAAGFPAHLIEKLLDGQATRSAIIGALASLEEKTGPRDVVVVYFSGHGTKVRVRFTGGLVQRREGLVPYDRLGRRDANHVIVDLEIRDILQALGRRGREVVLILDTCFAGGNYRSVGTRDRFLPLEDAPPVILHRPPDRAGRDWRDPFQRSGWHAESLVLLAACQAEESAKEIDVAGHAYGLFTTRLSLALRQALDGWNYERLQEQAYLAVVESASKLGHEQRPRLKGAGQRHLFAGAPIRRAPWVSVLARNGSMLQLDVGAVEGARLGLIYELAEGAAEDPETFAWCRIEQVEADSAWARLIELEQASGACEFDRARDRMATRGFPANLSLGESLRATMKTLTSERPLEGGLRVELHRRQGDAEWSEVEPAGAGEFIFSEEDGLRLIARNESPEPIFLTILSEGIGEAPELYGIRTLLGLETALEPGERFDLAEPPELLVDLYFPPAFDGASGLETYFVLASTRSVPWWFWCLDHESRKADPLRGGVHDEDRWHAVELPVRLLR